MKTVVQELAVAFDARERCNKTGNKEWEARWNERIAQLIDTLPQGSGFDTRYAEGDVTMDKRGRLVIQTSFHHMNDGGYYDGWTEHTVTVSPAFDGIDIKVSGRDRNDIKNYIAEVFNDALMAEAPDMPGHNAEEAKS